jgi:hypothetical protein
MHIDFNLNGTRTEFWNFSQECAIIGKRVFYLTVYEDGNVYLEI